MINKIKKDGMFYITRRCIHFVDIKGNSIITEGNCNIKPKINQLLSKNEINSNINRYQSLKKCDWCLSKEDIEVE